MVKIKSLRHLLLTASHSLRDNLVDKTAQFRNALAELGFDVLPGEHPIIPIMLYDAALAAQFSDKMLKQGVYVVAFSYSVVPNGKARIRTQVSAAFTDDDTAFALSAFAKVKNKLGI